MNVGRRLTGFVFAGLALASAAVAAQQTAPAPVTLTPEQMEQFLLQARVVRSREISTGITNSRRATLSDGTLTHDAHVQVVDEYKPVFSSPTYAEVGFRDTYRYNVAAYRLARLLGLDNVPVSVARNVDGQPASLTWWIDDVMMDEAERRKKDVVNPDRGRHNDYVYRMHIFDVLILNRDRNLGNIVYSSDWKLWMIDHTRGFRLLKELLEPQRLARMERSLFQRLKGLTAAALAEATGNTLLDPERDALLARRDLLVAHFEGLVAARGEAAVLYTLDP